MNNKHILTVCFKDNSSTAAMLQSALAAAVQHHDMTVTGSVMLDELIAEHPSEKTLSLLERAPDLLILWIDMLTPNPLERTNQLLITLNGDQRFQFTHYHGVILKEGLGDTQSYNSLRRHFGSLLNLPPQRRLTEAPDLNPEAPTVWDRFIGQIIADLRNQRIERR
ncbi:MAG: hypothetical protein ACOYUK_03300 [Patescibacteria group bacterium]